MDKKKSLISASIILFLVVFYLYVPYYRWLPSQVIEVPDGDSGGIVDGVISDHFRLNMIWRYLGDFGQLFFFTVQTFYLLVVVLLAHAFMKNELSRLFINFAKAYAGLVSVLYLFMVLPFIPITQAPWVFAIETIMHIIVPAMFIYFTRDVEFESNQNNWKLFMVFPIVYYISNWTLAIASGFNAWTYPFFNFANPVSLGLATPFVIMFNLMMFVLLVVIFITTWRVYEKIYGRINKKSS